MLIFDRVILTIYTFILTLLSLSIVAVALKIVSLEIIWTSLQLNIYGKWEAALVGLVFFLISVRLLVAGIMPRGSRQAIVQESALGSIQISLGAIESLVQKVARQIKGVRTVKARVVNRKQGICIYIKAIVSPDVSIPDTSDDLQNRVSNYINDVVGTHVADIRIFVEDISNEVGMKPRARVE